MIEKLEPIKAQVRKCSLHLVPETPASQIARLQAEARDASLAELEAVVHLALELQARAEALAWMPIPVGIQEAMRQYAETTRVVLLNVAILQGRK